MMNILHLAPHDFKGGACRIAWYLFEGTRRRGLTSHFAVGCKSLGDADVVQIEHFADRGRTLLSKVRRRLDIMRGHANFNYPATKKIPDMFASRPDILHAHNLQGNYFDLRQLPALSQQYPFVLTLHDTWMLSGHCAYFIECERWRNGCGECPDLERAPSVLRDATAYNWSRKQNIYRRSKLFVATPSQWLLDQVRQSVLVSGVVMSRVIPNGVDLTVFRPGDKQAVRQELGIPENAIVLLYVVAGHMKQNEYKDYDTIENALNQLQTQVSPDKQIVFLGLGGEEEATEILGNLQKRFVPYQTDLKKIVSFYQAADIYLHAARADTFPNAILEALACGTPVIATDVGGIGEQVRAQRTGFLVPPKAAQSMAQSILDLMADDDKLEVMSFQAAEDACKRFSVERMIDDYIKFYEEVLRMQQRT